MKFISCLLFIAGFLTAKLHAGDALARPTADEAWRELESLGLAVLKYPEGFREMTGRQQSDWCEERAYRLQSQGLAFYQNYPTDPRRWKLVRAMVMNAPRFVIGYGPKIETDWRDVISNETALAAWQACLRNMVTQMHVATDVSASDLESLDYFERLVASVQAGRAAEMGQRVDWSKLLADAEDFLRRYPESRFAPPVLLMTLDEFERAHSMAETAEMFQRYVTSSNAKVAEVAQAKVKMLGLATTPMDLRFIAVDGREVDLAKLRGKVVLVDFWATWCGPCKEEIPNVKKVYAAYRDKGFEIVGVALENGRYKEDDTSAQRTEKQEKAKKVLTDFTATNNMAWPQYFDGKFWDNAISTQYSIGSIPAMFLLDQDGKVVSTNARGEALEREVKKLLKL
ncbi:MAG: TlpA disulfide reductase family protein [Lacunisphaera sp.]